MKPLLNAYKEVAFLAEKLNLPTAVVNRANDLFTTVREGRHLQGRSHNTISSACLYVACWQLGEEGAPRTLQEICAVGKYSSEREMSTCVNFIVDNLNTPLKKITASDFIPRFCSDLGLPIHVQEAAVHIARKTVELGIVSTGRTPTAVAVAAIYTACQAYGQKKTRKEFVEVSGISDTTIQTIYKLIYLRANEVFPDGFHFASGMPLM